MRKFAIFLFSLILSLFFFISFAHAGFASVGWASWFQSGNADYRLLGGNGYTAYAKNFQNPATNVSNSSYILCSINPSLFEPISYDFNNDGFQEIFVSRAHALEVYDISCTLLFNLNFGAETIAAMPVLTNTNNDNSLEIIVLTEKLLYQFRYNTASLEFELQSAINYSALNPGLTLLTCPFETYQYCLAWSNGYNSTWVFDLDSSTVTEKTGNLGTKVLHGTIVNGMSSALIDSTHYITPLCYVAMGSGASSDTVRCPMINASGDNIGNLSSGALGATLGSSQTRISAFVAKHGTIQRIFVSGTDGTICYHFITDTSGTALFTARDSCTGVYPSNWMIGDYNKDGLNEACIMANILATGQRFRCHNQGLAAIINFAPSGEAVQWGGHGVMADFFPQYPTMGIGDVGGIAYFNSTGGYNRTYNVGTGTTGEAIVVNGATGAVPALIFTDGSTISWLLVNTQFNTACGDGICADGENVFTCPDDCNASETGAGITETGTGASCTDNSDCASGLCEYGVCTLKKGSGPCTSDSQCLSGDCSNNACTTPGYWEQIEQSKTQQFGNTGKTNNFIAMFFMLMIPAGIIWMGKSGVAAIAATGTFFALAVFFTLVGWLSPFIFIGIVIVALLIIVLGIMIKGGG